VSYLWLHVIQQNIFTIRDMLPETWECYNGKPVPKLWATPARLAAYEQEQLRTLEAQGMTRIEALQALYGIRITE
jgi:hypothetical protein